METDVAVLVALALVAGFVAPVTGTASHPSGPNFGEHGEDCWLSPSERESIEQGILITNPAKNDSGDWFVNVGFVPSHPDVAFYHYTPEYTATDLAPFTIHLPPEKPYDSPRSEWAGQNDYHFMLALSLVNASQDQQITAITNCGYKQTVATVTTGQSVDYHRIWNPEYESFNNSSRQ